MKKFKFIGWLIGTILITSSIGCTELHQMAEASLDDNRISYKGPSPYPPPLGSQNENFGYLILEDFINDIFWPFTDLFYDDAGSNTAYDPSNYDAGNRPFLQSNFVGPKTPPKGTTKRSLMLSEGLEYIGKGGKEKAGTATTTTRLNYLEVPILLNYYGRIGNSKNAYHVGLGPWVAYALSGKFKSTGQSAVAINFGSSGDFTRADYGAGFKAGVLFSKKWDVSLGYDLGMNNLLATKGAINDGDKGKTRNVSLSIGYWFK